MVKILFLIHDLGQGGAEKVLVNLVNNMDATKFDISVTALFGGGVNEQFLAEHIRLIVCHKKAIRGKYPTSSKIVNSGKKIAMGGSITAMTRAAVRYIPSISKPESHQGQLFVTFFSSRYPQSSSNSNSWDG